MKNVKMVSILIGNFKIGETEKKAINKDLDYVINAFKKIKGIIIINVNTRN